MTTRHRGWRLAAGAMVALVSLSMSTATWAASPSSTTTTTVKPPAKGGGGGGQTCVKIFGKKICW